MIGLWALSLCRMWKVVNKITEYHPARVSADFYNELIFCEESKLCGGEGEREEGEREGDETVEVEVEGDKKTKEKEEETQTCKCVNCEEDAICGHLWKGRNNLDRENISNDDINAKKIHIVISHCNNDLDWLSEYTRSFNIASVHVISKCGVPVLGLPNNLSTGNIKPSIEVLPNVGRCDHSYAHYINTILDQKVVRGEEENSVVLFLKDTATKKYIVSGKEANSKEMFTNEWNDIKSMVKGASSTNGFSCGAVLQKGTGGHSVYHKFDTLLTFSISMYDHNEQGYKNDQAKFISSYTNLGSFVNSLDVGSFPNAVQVCYGGVFAASVSNIKKTNSSVWNTVEKILSRGNNIQEGHYMERLWGMLLSTPLLQFQADAMIKCTEFLSFKHNHFRGCLVMTYNDVLSCNYNDYFDKF